MPDLSIVIPVYNGAGSIERLVEDLNQLEIEGDLEIILVNDCSPDESWSAILRAQSSSKVPVYAVDLAKNYGEHNAVMAGYSIANGKHIINIDDDFQNPPSEIIKVFEYARAHQELDVVYTYYEKKHHHIFRNLGSKFNDIISNFILEKPRDLYLSSFRCITRRLKYQILKYTGPYPYIDGLILQNTSRIGKVKVAHVKRVDGRSGYTLRKLVRLWMSMFLNFSTLPLRISSITGILFSLLGIILAVIAVIDRFINKIPEGYTSIIAAILIFSGVQLLILGIIGEYLGRLYLTAVGKPQHHIREVIHPTGDVAGHQ